MSLNSSLFKGSAADHWYLLLHVSTSDNSRSLWRVSKPCSIGQWLNTTIKGSVQFRNHWIRNTFCNRFTSPAYANLHSSEYLDGIHNHSILFIYFLFYAYEHFTYTYVHQMRASAWGDREDGILHPSLDSLKLELRIIESHRVGAWNWTQVLCKSNKCSQPLSYLSIAVHFSVCRRISEIGSCPGL